MSDFLSKFSHEHYEKDRGNHNRVGENEKMEEKTDPPASDRNDSGTNAAETSTMQGGASGGNLQTEHVQEQAKSARGANSDWVEIDSNYQLRQKKKKWFWFVGAFLFIGGIFFLYRQVTYVTVPDFKGKPLSDVRQWATEQKINIAVKQTYDEMRDANEVLAQTVRKKTLKKGATLTVTASLGPDPEQKIHLPDFTKMVQKEAITWVDKQKAENVSLIEDYSDTVPKGNYLKQEFANKELKAAAYRRRDKLILYYSKGKEIFTKDIPVLAFEGKTEEEVSEWAKKQELVLVVQQQASETVEVGKIIQQTPAKETKLAKKDKFTVVVSSGKASEVPNFQEIAMDEAETATSGLTVQMKQQYSLTADYGQFLSQSVKAGEIYTEKAEKPIITVVYSIGRPYLKDLRETMVEGELAKYFYEEFHVKKARIQYQTYLVDSSSPKGTVVEMSRYNEYLSLETNIRIGISRGNLTNQTTSPTTESVAPPLKTDREEED